MVARGGRGKCAFRATSLPSVPGRGFGGLSPRAHGRKHPWLTRQELADTVPSVSTSTFNISLSPQLARFVRAKVADGNYASASEVMREALRWFAKAMADDIPTLVDLQEQRIDRKRARTAVQRLLRMRKGTTLGPGLSVLDLRDVGRR